METKELRSEITARVVMLHNQLNIASVLFFFLLLAVIFLASQNNTELINWLLLGSFVVFASLTFNYQANQMTMEAVAKYLLKIPQKEASGWEDFYNDYKKRVRMISVAKVSALILPQILILIWLIIILKDLSQPQILLLALDGLLGLAVILNFKYKTKFLP